MRPCFTALPALESALQSLKLLTRNDVVEVKALKSPPAGVKLVMEAGPNDTQSTFPCQVQLHLSMFEIQTWDKSSGF